MALTPTQRGTAGSTTLGTTLVLTPSSNLTAGARAVLVVAADNNPDSGGGISSVADSKGNTWTKKIDGVYDPALVNEGVAGAFFETAQDAGALTTGDTVTVTFSNSITSKAAILVEVTGSVGVVAYKDGAFGAGAKTTTPSITSSSLASGDLIIGGLCAETGTAPTADSDTSNGTWSAVTYAEGDTGTSETSMSVAVQTKVTTGAGTQTFNPTYALATDTLIGWVAYEEQTAPPFDAAGPVLLVPPAPTTTTTNPQAIPQWRFDQVEQLSGLYAPIDEFHPPGYLFPPRPIGLLAEPSRKSLAQWEPHEEVPSGGNLFDPIIRFKNHVDEGETDDVWVRDRADPVSGGFWMSPENYAALVGPYLTTFMGMDVLTSGTAATYTPPADTKTMLVICVSGGGGGGGAEGTTSEASAGGGGGAGGHALRVYTFDPDVTYTYTVGQGGAGGDAATGGTGGDGTQSSFTDGTTVTNANNGVGAPGMMSGTAIEVVDGAKGNGGAAASGALTRFGGAGGCGMRLSGTIAISGKGGDSFIGAGGEGSTENFGGDDAQANSGGGGGGAKTDNASDATGGDGGSGVIIVLRFG